MSRSDADGPTDEGDMMMRTRPRHQLADEHAGLLEEVDRRVHLALDAAARGRSTAPELAALLAYLRCEVLDEAVNTESLLYPRTEGTPSADLVPALLGDHRRLRRLTDELVWKAEGGSAQRGDESTRRLLLEIRRTFADHLHAEEAALAPVTDACVDDLRWPHRSHDWFILTEGPVIDLDQIPPGDVVPAVLERLTRLRQGEDVEVRSRRHLGCLRAAFGRRRMCADYGWAYLEEGPERWRVEIARRVG